MATPRSTTGRTCSGVGIGWFWYGCRQAPPGGTAALVPRVKPIIRWRRQDQLRPLPVPLADLPAGHPHPGRPPGARASTLIEGNNLIWLHLAITFAVVDRQLLPGRTAGGEAQALPLLDRPMKPIVSGTGGRAPWPWCLILGRPALGQHPAGRRGEPFTRTSASPCAEQGLLPPSVRRPPAGPGGRRLGGTADRRGPLCTWADRESRARSWCSTRRTWVASSAATARSASRRAIEGPVGKLCSAWNDPVRTTRDARPRGGVVALRPSRCSEPEVVLSPHHGRGT